MNLLLQEPLLDIEEIQGNILRGFDTQWQELIGFKSTSEAMLRNWLSSLTSEISTLKEVHEYRLSRSRDHLPDTNPVLINASISGFALKMLQFDTAVIGEGFLNLPMGSLAVTLGDSKEDVAKFKLGKDKASTPEVLLLIGSEQKDALVKKSDLLIARAEEAGLQLIYREMGAKLPGDIEHFGFRDGISQVGVRGLLNQTPVEPLTLRQIEESDPKHETFAAPGRPLVWPGQFVYGYPTQQEQSTVPGPLSGQSEWLRNGSLLVFRRLTQDVAAFRNFLTETAPKLDLTADQLSAKIVGRWPDGTPLILSPESTDPLIVADAMRINHFNYGGTNEVIVKEENGSSRTVTGTYEDNNGLRCPHLAHIRKVNPRDLNTDQGGPGRTLMMQMIRRGIPFGPLYDPKEKEMQERGLLFLSYQTSFNEQFKKLNTQWMNNPDAPEVGQHNHDLLVGQSLITKERSGTLPDKPKISTEAKWVIPSGGCFMFSPSIDFFRKLTLV